MAHDLASAHDSASVQDFTSIHDHKEKLCRDSETIVSRFRQNGTDALEQDFQFKTYEKES